MVEVRSPSVSTEPGYPLFRGFAQAGVTPRLTVRGGTGEGGGRVGFLDYFRRSRKSSSSPIDSGSPEQDRDDATHRLAGLPVVDDSPPEAERPFDEDAAREDLRAHADTVRGMVKTPGLSVGPGGRVSSTGTARLALAPSSFGRGAADSGIRPRGFQPAEGSLADVGPQGANSGLPGLESGRRKALKEGVFQRPSLDSTKPNAPSHLSGARFGQQARRKMNPQRDRFAELVAGGKGKFAPIVESADESVSAVNPATGFDADAYEQQLEAKQLMHRRFMKGEISVQELDRFLGNDLPVELPREKPFDAGSTLEMGQAQAPARPAVREMPVPDRSPGLEQMWDSMEARSRAEAGARSREKLEFATEGPRTRNFTTDDLPAQEARAGARPTQMIEGPQALGEFVASREFFQGAGTEERPHQVRLDDTRYRYRRDANSDSREVAKPQALLAWERGAADRANQEGEIEGSMRASEARAKHLSRGNWFTSRIRKWWNSKSIKKSKGDMAAAQQQLAGLRSQWDETDRSLNRSEAEPRAQVDPESPLAPGYGAQMASDAAAGMHRWREAEEAPAVRAELDPFYDRAQARSEDILAQKGSVIADPASGYKDPRQVYPAPEQPRWGVGGWRDYSEWDGEETTVEEGLRRADVRNMYSRENFDRAQEQWNKQMDATLRQRSAFETEQRRMVRPSPTLADIYARQEESYGDVGYGSEQVDRQARGAAEKEALRRAARKLKGGFTPTSEDSAEQVEAKGTEARRQQGLITDAEEGGLQYPKAKAALGALSDASTGELTQRQEASDLALAKEAQREEGRAAFWGPIEKQRADKQREREEAQKAAEAEQQRQAEEQEREAEEQLRLESIRARYAGNLSTSLADGGVSREVREDYQRQQNPDAGLEHLSLRERMKAKKEQRAERERAEAERWAPIRAQSRAIADAKEKESRVASEESAMAQEGLGVKDFDPSSFSVSNRFDPDSPDLLAEIEAMEQKSKAQRLSVAAEAGGARASVTNRGISVTEDYADRVQDREQEWRTKLLEELPYSRTGEGLKDKARMGEITSPDYYQGLAAFEEFQEEKSTAERFKRGTVAYDYEGGRDMTPEERLDAAWQSAETGIDNEARRRKQNNRQTLAGNIKGAFVDKHKVSDALLRQTMTGIDAPDAREKEVKGLLKSYMGNRKAGVEKGLIRRPEAQKSIAPRLLPGEDPERLEAFLRGKGVLGKKSTATPDLLDAYSMSPADFAKKRMGQMWVAPPEQTMSQPVVSEEQQEPEEMMTATRPRRRIMMQEGASSGESLQALQQQLQGGQAEESQPAQQESHAEYRERTRKLNEWYQMMQGSSAFKPRPQEPVTMPSAPLTKEEYLAREKAANDERQAWEKQRNTKEGKARAKQHEEYIRSMGLSTGEKLTNALESVKAKFGGGGPKLRSLEEPTGEAAEDLRVHLEDNRQIREHNATVPEAMVPERTYNQSIEDRTVAQRPGGISLATSYFGDAGSRANPLSAQRNLVVDPEAMSEGMPRVEEGQSGNAGRQGIAPIQITDYFATNATERQEAQEAHQQASAPSRGVINLPANAGQQSSGGLGARIMNAIGLGSSSQQAQQPAPVPPAVIRPEHRLAAQRSTQGRQGITEADRAKYVEDTARSIAEREAGKLRDPAFKAPDLKAPTVARSGPGLMDRLEDGMESMGAQMESGLLSSIGQANIPLVSMAANAQNSMNTSARAASTKEQAKAAAKAEAEQRELAEKLQRTQAQGLMKSIVAGAKTPELMGDLYAESSQRKAQGRAGMQDKLLADYDNYQKLRTDYKAKAHKKAEGEYADYTIEREELPKGDLMREMLVPDFDLSASIGDIMKGDKIKHGYFRVPRRK